MLPNDLRISCKRLARSCSNLTFRRRPSARGGARNSAKKPMSAACAG